MTLSPEERSLLALHLVPGIGPRLTAALLERFGTAAAALSAGPAELTQIPHVGEVIAEALLRARDGAAVAVELERIAKHQVELLFFGSPGYPASLLEIPTAPRLLYVRGTLNDADAKAVGIVGSRSCTAYGLKWAGRLAADLARAGYTVVSGLARGIDGAAHRGALEAKGRTVAVLAGGLSRIYPPEHKGLAEEVTASGALVSEAAMPMEPMAGMFPARNRIISGLSRGAIIIEAAEKSGALITASHAADQGRTVFALPGAVDSPASGGTNALIREGAVLVRSAEDVLEELEGVSARAQRSKASKPDAPARPATPPPELDATQRRVWECLAGEPRHLDEVVQSLGLPVQQVSGLLFALELKRVVRRLPGNRYERC